MNPVLLLCFIGAAITAVAVPWMGVVVAYWVAVFNPQSVWWWQFDGFRPAYFVTLPMLAGVAIAGLRGRLEFRNLLNLQSAGLLILLACCAISARFGPYAFNGEGHAVRNASYVLEIQAKIILLFALGCLCATSESAVKAMAWMLTACVIYMVYWANDLYLSLGWIRRLEGPKNLEGNGAYVDENNFAAFFVTTLPFVWYLSFTVQNKLLKYVMWMVVPFGWHAVFLTGSRGGLLGLLAVLLFVAMRKGHRKYGIALLVAFGLAYHYQAGDTMKERASTIDNYDEDASASGRLDAWEAATNMMAAHPITGVGPGAFLRAFPNYSDREPLQAHNTYFQIGAEYGPLAAVGLLVSMVAAIMGLVRARRSLLQRLGDKRFKALWAINEATLAGFIGLFVCSLFLTLQLYELLYCMIFLATACLVCVRRAMSAASAPVAPFARPQSLFSAGERI